PNLWPRSRRSLMHAWGYPPELFLRPLGKDLYEFVRREGGAVKSGLLSRAASARHRGAAPCAFFGERVRLRLTGCGIVLVLRQGMVARPLRCEMDGVGLKLRIIRKPNGLQDRRIGVRRVGARPRLAERPKLDPRTELDRGIDGPALRIERRDIRWPERIGL